MVKVNALTSETIKKTALEVLLEEGIEFFSARHIAERGNFNPSLINYHFGGRDQLLLHTAVWAFSIHVQDMASKIESQHNVQDMWKTWLKTVISYNTEHPTAAVVASYPELFIGQIDPIERKTCALQIKQQSEVIGAILFSMAYASAKGKPYKRLSAARVTAVALLNPKIKDFVALVSIGAGGIAAVQAQHRQAPIFGFDIESLFGSALQRLLAGLSRGGKSFDLDEG